MSETPDRSSKLSIVQGAFALLTKELPNDVPESYDDAERAVDRHAALLYPDAYDAVLSARPWPSATERDPITADEADQDEYSLADGVVRFKLPSDYLRLVRVQGCRKQDRRIMGEFLEVKSPGAAAIVIHYVKRVAEEKLLRAPLLRDAISAHLAWKIARLITDSEASRDRMKNIAALALDEAWSTEAGQQGTGSQRGSAVLDAIDGYQRGYREIY